MDNPSSPLDTLRQLKEMLDAGALTPTEFEALKQRLVFQEPAAPAAPVVPAPPVVPPAAEAPVPPAAPVSPPAAPYFTQASANDAAPATPAYVPPVVRRTFETEAPAPPPAAFVPQPETEPEVSSAYVADEFVEAAAPTARSPLALILSIGGLLVLLSLVLYLSLNNRPSERISSTSLTAADTLAAPIETGPQAAQLPTAAAPETIRVAPTNPAPVVQPRAAPAVRDTVAARDEAAADTSAGQ